MKILTNFHLSDVECPFGATLAIRPLSKSAAQELVLRARQRNEKFEFVNDPPRQLDRIVEAMNLPFQEAYQLRMGETVLVVEAQQWNNIRCYQVEFVADGNGELPTTAAQEQDPFEE